MSTTNISFPLFYRLFFLYIEPISALVGSYYAAGQPTQYLTLLSSSPTITSSTIPTPTLITLYQLSNLYLLFALNEYLVLSSTTSLKTWRRLLFCLLVADLGHLATMWPLALEKGVGFVYWNVARWNAMEWGSVGFVYCGALMRISFLFGAGIGGGAGESKRTAIREEEGKMKKTH